MPSLKENEPRRRNGYFDRLRRNPRVEIVDDERAIGNGVIITFKQGWSFDPLQDNRVAGADTFREAIELVRSAKEFGGPYDG